MSPTVRPRWLRSQWEKSRAGYSANFFYLPLSVSDWSSSPQTLAPLTQRPHTVTGAASPARQGTLPVNTPLRNLRHRSTKRLLESSCGGGEPVAGARRKAQLALAPRRDGGKRLAAVNTAVRVELASRRVAAPRGQRRANADWLARLPRRSNLR